MFRGSVPNMSMMGKTQTQPLRSVMSSRDPKAPYNVVRGRIYGGLEILRPWTSVTVEPLCRRSNGRDLYCGSFLYLQDASRQGKMMRSRAPSCNWRMRGGRGEGSSLLETIASIPPPPSLWRWATGGNGLSRECISQIPLQEFRSFGRSSSRQ